MKRLLFVVLLALAPSCSTVHQSEVAPARPGFNAAPIRVGDGYLVDDAFRDRYNALVAIYGHKRLENGAPVFVPALERDAGVAAASFPHQWTFSLEAMENMIVLEGLKRRGAPP